jgi:hypothetical protein
MDLYDQAKEGMTSLESFVSGLPVISDYRNKELRRDADKKLRESIAATLENDRRKLTALQRDMVSAGRLSDLPEMERVVGRLQLLIDRIRTAAYGYSPFYDAQEIREEELDRLIDFDQQMADQITVIGERIDALSAALAPDEEFDITLDALMDDLVLLHEQFDQREQVISYLADQ